MSLHIGQEKMLLQGQIIIAKNTLEKAHGVMEGGGGFKPTNYKGHLYIFYRNLRKLRDWSLITGRGGLQNG